MSKNQISPAAFGTVSCVLMILSRALLLFPGSTPQLLNYIIVVITLCLCVHFVRGTAHVFREKLWRNSSLLILICMPVFNLIVTALELIAPESALLSSRLTLVVLIAFSVPAFFCYYFFYIARCFHRERGLLRAVIALDAVGAVYLALRQCDLVVFPLIEAGRTYEILPFLKNAAVFSSKLSVLVYLLSVVCFFFLQKALKRLTEAGPISPGTENFNN